METGGLFLAMGRPISFIKIVYVKGRFWSWPVTVRSISRAFPAEKLGLSPFCVLRFLEEVWLWAGRWLCSNH